MAASDLPRYVVDASVAVKWHLRDESDTTHADALLIEFREGRVQLLAPDHIRYEVPSAIRNALRTKRLTPLDGSAAIREFLSWRITAIRSDALIIAAYDRALRFGCSLYDGLYLALAERASCPLVYADSRLRYALGHRFPHSLWLTDYVPTSRP
jgi:predicted nucleic acid-binding protein